LEFCFSRWKLIEFYKISKRAQFSSSHPLDNFYLQSIIFIDFVLNSQHPLTTFLHLSNQLDDTKKEAEKFGIFSSLSAPIYHLVSLFHLILFYRLCTIYLLNIVALSMATRCAWRVKLMGNVFILSELFRTLQGLWKQFILIILIFDF
jgi:hypothetical protein